MRHRSLLLSALVLVAAACGDDPTSARPQPAAPVSILDDGSTGGNPNFFFLPPVAPSPSSHPAFSPGKFNGTWTPIVTVCPVSITNLDAGCTSGTVRTYSGSAVSVSLADEQYQVQVDTKEPWAVGGQTYRFTVELPGGIDLGFVDITLLSGAAKNARTGTTVELNDGRTIPLKFRIERPAADLATEALVSQADGGIVRLNGDGGPGSLAIQFPAGFIPQELLDQGVTQVLITAERLNTPSTNPCIDPVVSGALLKAGDCWRIESYPSLPRLAEDVTVAFCPGIPLGDAGYDQQSMYKFDAPDFLRELENVETSLVDCTPDEGEIGALPDDVLGKLRWGATHVARGLGKVFGPNTAYAIDVGLGGRLRASAEPVEEGSVFSVFFWAIEAELHADAASTSPPVVGLPHQVVVAVHGDHHGDEEGVAGVTVTAGAVANAIVAPASAVTNADGNATFTVTPIATGPLSVSFGATLGSGLSTVYSATALATAPVAIFIGSVDVTGTTQFIATDFAENLTVSGPPSTVGCVLTTNAPSIVNVDGLLAVANGTGTAIITATCGTASAIVTFVVTESTVPPPATDSIRVLVNIITAMAPVTETNNVGVLAGTSRELTVLPYLGGVPVERSCTYLLTNPPGASPFVSISGASAGGVTVNGLLVTSPTAPALLAITCGSNTRTLNIFVQTIG